MAKGTAYEGFAALYDGTGNSAKTLCESITTKCVLEYEQVLASQTKPIKGAPLGRLSDLYPLVLIKAPLVAHAALFASQVAEKGFEPLTAIYQFQVWGPYMEKVGPITEWTPEEGNHLIRKADQRQALKVWSYQGNEFDWSKGCAFLIRGSFTQKASSGHVDEETGVLLV